MVGLAFQLQLFMHSRDEETGDRIDNWLQQWQTDGALRCFTPPFWWRHSHTELTSRKMSISHANDHLEGYGITERGDSLSNIPTLPFIKGQALRQIQIQAYTGSSLKILQMSSSSLLSSSLFVMFVFLSPLFLFLLLALSPSWCPWEWQLHW